MVPMQIGVHFGFRYQVDGPVAGEPVAAHAGDPLSDCRAAAVRSAARRCVERIASTSVGTTHPTPDYSFDQAWEFVPGTWTLAGLRQRDRMLAENSFTVVDGPASVSARARPIELLPAFEPSSGG